MRYECGPQLRAVEAIDVHVHAEVDGCGHTSLPPEYLDASARYFKGGQRTPAVESIAEDYRGRQMAAVVFTVDARTQLGRLPSSIDDLVDRIAEHHDALIPFGSVDPRTGDEAVLEARRQVETLGVRGFKFHPSVQGFDPSSPAYDPLWRTISELHVPALFHTGQNGIGAGMPGGGGIRLRYSNPMLLDDIAASHPDLTIIMAHPSVPWQDEANSIAIHKPNVFIDLSGWSPRYFPDSLVRYASTLLSRKLLFGTDYPLITPEKWLEAFATLPIREEIRPSILKHNAMRVLGLDPTGP